MRKLKILVIGPNYIGDILMITPSLRILKKLYPESEINVITTQQGKEILEKNPNIDNIIIRNKKLKISDRISLIRKVISYSPDYVFLFRTTLFYVLLSYLSNSKYRFGVGSGFINLFLTKSIKPDIKRPYRQECVEVINLSLNEKYPFFSELYKLEIYTDELEKKYITDLLFRYKLEPKKIVLISPGSTRPSKLWQPEKYAQVINKLSEKGYSVILTGTKSDTIISEIIKYTNRHLIILTELNLKQYAELIKNSILFIGSDSGGFYISIACNVNSVCLFGSTDPEKYGPFDKERQKIIYKKLNCSPCYKKICPKTKKSFLTPCMEKITVDDILTAINNYIEI